jgi:hypothetical protein
MTQLHTPDPREVLVARLHAARAELRPAQAVIATSAHAPQLDLLPNAASGAAPPVQQIGNSSAPTPPNAAALGHPWAPLVVDLLFSAFGDQRVADVLHFGRQNMGLIELIYAIFRRNLPKLTEK